MTTSAIEWVAQVQALTEPGDVVWCAGAPGELDRLLAIAEREGTLTALNPEKRPRSYLARTHPRDVARVEDRTYVCTPTEAEAGPNNNWRNPEVMRRDLLALFQGAMRGRTMYVIPFVMGPLGSKSSRPGLQVTDSAYVAASMMIMTRVDREAFDQLASKHQFVRAWHSVGDPLSPGQQSDPWPHNETVHVAHFPQDLTVMSFGSGYGGNALLAKKCFALRLASYAAHQEGWLAEHMLIVKVTNPQGMEHYVAGAFPSACGKTNLAMLKSVMPGWQVETVGDDIAWIRIGEDGRLWAINPEAGFFGVAPGTSPATNPVATEMLESDTIFTNVAMTKDGDVWWEGLTTNPPADLVDWRGKEWHPDLKTPAAHPNARFTVSVEKCSSLAPEWNSPEGVPLSAILVGGRRPDTVPLVTESFDWQHGVFLGAGMSSAQTAAAEGEIGLVRRDPFAMLPFCGYDMATYWEHWLSIPRLVEQRTGLSQDEISRRLPKIFQVNWFRTDQSGAYIWPGFFENLRVLSWVVSRVAGEATATTNALGKHPTLSDPSFDGLPLSAEQLQELFSVDVGQWTREVESVEQYFDSMGERVPTELRDQLQNLRKRLAS